MVSLEDDDPFIIERMLSYLYTLDYSDNAAARPALSIKQNWPPHLSKEESKSVLQVDARVYALAEKYDISGLKDLAKYKYETALNNCSGGDFLKSIQDVYGLTRESDRGLRDLVIKHTRGHMPDLKDKNEFTLAIEEIGEFSLDLLKAVLNSPVASWRGRYCHYCCCERDFRCASCGRI